MDPCMIHDKGSTLLPENLIKQEKKYVPLLYLIQQTVFLCPKARKTRT